MYTSSELLTQGTSPYEASSSVVVGADATLALEPGVTIYFAPGAQLLVDGKLDAVGNSTHPIRLLPLWMKNETQTSPPDLGLAFDTYFGCFEVTSTMISTGAGRPAFLWLRSVYRSAEGGHCLYWVFHVL